MAQGASRGEGTRRWQERGLAVLMRFVACPIDRAATFNVRKDPRAVQEVLSSAQARFVLVHSKRVLGSWHGGRAGLSWWTRQEVLGLAPRAEEEPIYLGPLRNASGALAGCQAFAVDVGALLSEADALAAGPGAEAGPLRWCSGRDLMISDASDDDVAIAGMALAMTGWHVTAKFDGRTGQPTVPVEGGAKRQVQGGSGKLYPRTDPVAIGLIMSADGRRILLGRGHKHPVGMYTCIAGFVDQCESVEEALRREALEEAGVRLGHVELMNSQPWPIGRAGSCELMLGCRAVALDEDIKVNPTELLHARWFTKAEVRKMLVGQHPHGFAVPPPFAIAHHLIRDWAHPPSAWRGIGTPAVACLVGLAVGVLLGRLRSRL
uniref:NAD(+) diphosphatase n=1 Tax=Alexandrium monilatum TaxID=311494 RepID=A0A7S4QSL4_9DINO